ncbi:cysteine--tRNA ligase [Hoeflea sp. G2-23]|uniref:Cysteine--tRNA ligase n=1 Tax=Hoeflea algicola TaxID=2983763 RepID=A0ABT3Z8E0_9HYPH|nr:cysteine--tRNA ligase [Hoeflea algicola]MCY0147604.1 cysteine--tRNA ligase [Hoeflea algicola]
MTELKFWNTLTRVKEEFTPIDPDNVRMYVCGPTVYDYAHIGNARPVIVFDVLFRLLRHVYGEDHVTYVRNITDVDDKINARALRDYPDLPLNEAIAKVTEKTAERFHKDAAALGCLPPTFEPRATAHIDGMIRMIQTLIDKGNAYVTSGREGREVLFAVASMPDYGKLSNRKLEDQQAGARIAVEDHKRNAADFVLWKESAADEPGWDGRFTESGETVTIHGRPGWHIECSVMSEHHLGETFDIHGGGLDLIFPHHENEIAQSCCAHGNERMANLWMHNGFLQVEGKKMSKSDGNFVTIAELLETEKFGGRKWPGEVLRLAMLMTHYREPIDFSVKRLEEAEAAIEKYRKALALLVAEGAISLNAADQNYQIAFPWAEAEIERIAIAPPLGHSVYDDLNTPNLKRFLDHSTRAILEGDFNLSDAATQVEVYTIVTLLNIAGLFVDTEQSNALPAGLVDQVQALVDQRLDLIKAKNWTDADTLRDQIVAMGIQLKDGKDPETGERVTTWEVKR